MSYSSQVVIVLISLLAFINGQIVPYTISSGSFNSSADTGSFIRGYFDYSPSTMVYSNVSIVVAGGDATFSNATFTQTGSNSPCPGLSGSTVAFTSSVTGVLLCFTPTFSNGFSTGTYQVADCQNPTCNVVRFGSGAFAGVVSTTSPLTTAAITSAAITSAALTTAPITSAALTTAPMTTAAMTTAAMTTAAVTSASMTTAAITSAAITSAAMTTGAPMTTAAITSAAMTTGMPMTTASMTTAPATTARMTSAPLTTVRMTSGLTVTTGQRVTTGNLTFTTGVRHTTSLLQTTGLMTTGAGFKESFGLVLIAVLSFFVINY